MALSGVHLVFCYVVDPSIWKGGATMLYDVDSSQTMSSAGVSTISAPASRMQALGGGGVMLSLYASAPIFYATGPAPNASGSARRYFDPSLQGGREDLIVNPGDKVAWVFA